MRGKKPLPSGNRVKQPLNNYIRLVLPYQLHTRVGIKKINNFNNINHKQPVNI